MRRPDLITTAGSTPRRAVVHGLAAAALAAALGYDLAAIASGATHAPAIAFGAGILLAAVVLVPPLLRTVHLLAAERAARSEPAESVAAPAAADIVAVAVAEPLAPEVVELAAGLVRVRHELSRHSRQLREAIDSGLLWRYQDQAPVDDGWREVCHPVSEARLWGLESYDVIAEAYAEVARVARVNALRLLTGSPAAQVTADRLPDALAAITLAIAEIDLVIGIVASQSGVDPTRTALTGDREPAAEIAAPMVIDLTDDEPLALEALLR